MDQEQTPKKILSDSFIDQVNQQHPLQIPNKKQSKKKYGHYQVLEKIGEGGMGVVYKVYDTVLNRELALKVLLHEDIHFKKRFVREAKATARLDHPNIVKFYNLFTEDDSLCIVMQYIPGMQLQQYIRQKNPTFKQKLQIMATIIEAVDYSHKYNILHRDIKPENIIVNDAGIPYLTDFGIAKVTETSEKSLTKTGTFMGTPDYMSPEQARGAFRELDARADVYSLGASLYEVVTGSTPFPAMNISEAIYTILYKKPLPPTAINDELPKAIDHICLKAIAKNKRKRYSTANNMAKDLKFFLKGESIILRHYLYKLRQVIPLLLLVCAFFALYNNQKIEKTQTSTIERVYFPDIIKMIASEKYSDAEKTITSIFAVSSKNAITQQTSYYLNMLNLYIGICIIKQQNYDKMKEALVYLEKAKKGLPKEPKVYKYLGLYYMKKGDLVNALSNLQTSADLQPYDSDTHYYIGKVQSLTQREQNKENKNTIKKYLRALRLNTLNFKAFASLYKEAVKYPHLQNFAHYHAIAINYAFTKFPAPNIFQNKLNEISRQNYESYFYWSNELFDEVTSQKSEVYYYHFANLQNLHIQKQLQNAVTNVQEKTKRISSTTIKNIFINNDNVFYRYLAACALLHTHDSHHIFKCMQSKDYKKAIISLCALHSQGIPIKVPFELLSAIETENDITLQTLLAQNIKKLDIKQLEIWMASSNQKLQLCAAANIFNQENISKDLQNKTQKILIKNMDNADIATSRYAHYHFWKSIYSKEYGNEAIYKKGLDHKDHDINAIVLRLCRIFNKKSLSSYTNKYLSDGQIGKRNLNLVYALGCIESGLVQKIIDDPKKPLLLRILSQHIMIYTLSYFQKHPIFKLRPYLEKNSQEAPKYKNENMRSIHYAYLATTVSYNITYDFTQFFEGESKFVQQNIMYSLKCASVRRKTVAKQIHHSNKIKWVKKHLNNPSDQIRHHAWAAWVIMSESERTEIFKKAFDSKDPMIRQGVASGFYNIFYFYIRRIMPEFNERMTSLQNFNELYYEHVERIVPSLSSKIQKKLEKNLTYAIRLDPKVSHYYHDRALFFKMQKKDSLARKDIEQAILQKETPRYLLTRAQFLSSKKSPDKLKIESILSKVLALANNKTIRHKVGTQYFKIGMYNKAKEIFWKIHLQDPTDVLQSIWLVKIFWATNQKEKAKEFLRAVIEIENQYLRHINSYRVKKMRRRIPLGYLKLFLPELPNIDSFTNK
ncbi:protein kinase [Candidatus Uabimicrobium sp. HlEnr_7]|uniref:protein kinase domain-containing protein n=1 Tax=Candidatus Uabimicrobium helgolandensis TaxID=3095367 RepID=UPI0035586CA6